MIDLLRNVQDMRLKVLLLEGLERDPRSTTPGVPSNTLTSL
jgi:hypothetical protein